LETFTKNVNLILKQFIMINRRLALEKITLMLGGMVSTPLMAGVLGKKMNNNVKI
jgi:hypothetical protein